jgi:hypothetical protein
MSRLNCLESRFYPKISTFMLESGSAPTPPGDSQSDFSFVGQAPLMEGADAVICTAFSAVPVADAVRGYFEEKGTASPLLGYVHTKFRCDDSWYRSRPFDRDAEVTRLKPILDGITSAVIIDELKCNGDALNIGRDILLAAGVRSVTYMPGRWYIQAYHPEVDLDKVTSVHADFFKEIGCRAAQQREVKY